MIQRGGQTESSDLSGAGMSVLDPVPSKLSVEHWNLQNSFPTRKDVLLVQKGPGR